MAHPRRPSGNQRGRPRAFTLRASPLYIAGTVLAITLILFVVAGLMTRFSTALNIMEVNQKPFAKKYSDAKEAVTVALSVFGYVLVPTAIALAVTSVLQIFIGRRLATQRDLQRAVGALAARAQTEATQSLRAAGTTETEEAQPPSDDPAAAPGTDDPRA
jgi:hypothetical protein